MILVLVRLVVGVVVVIVVVGVFLDAVHARAVGDADANLTGWSLRDESTRHRYEFPDVNVAPGQLVRVRTGCGTDEVGSGQIELFWCDPEPPVWNNGGDTAFLLDFNGSIADYMESSRNR